MKFSKINIINERKARPQFHDSDAPDAYGRFKELSIKDLAAWLIKTRNGDVKRISSSLTQQIVFNRNDNPKYAEKMEKTRKEVYKQLGREDLLESIDNFQNFKKIESFDTFVKESAVNEKKAEGDRGPIDNKAIEKSLKTKSDETGIPLALLRIVMRRGMDAWNSGHRPGTNQTQWAHARVNAFLEKGKGTWQGADKDVAKEVRDGGHDKKLPWKPKD